MIHVIAVHLDPKIHFFCKAQLAFFVTNNTSIAVFSKYAEFVDVFLLKFVAKHSEYTSINNHSLNLIDSGQPLYEFIYGLGPVKLKILKTYIKTNLANSFI